MSEMGYEFMGFHRPDGRVGARNLVGVIPSVTCANDVAQAIVTEVQGTVGYFHHQGCCQLPPDLDRVTATLTSLGQSPNLGAVLIVSLGCEGTDFEQMYKTIEASGKPVRIIGIQELGGVSNAIQKGIDLARELVIEISGQKRVIISKNLSVSCQCAAYSDGTRFCRLPKDKSSLLTVSIRLANS